MQRRRDLSAGKTAVRVAAAPVVVRERSAVSETTVLPRAVPVASADDRSSCRDQALARRMEQSRRGRGDTPASQPTRPPRIGTLEYAPKVVVSQTQSGMRVTGVRRERGGHVTGDARGLALPVSGTQYIGVDSGAAWRAGGPKVGLARTPGGALVSGTLIRSNVSVTGDEAGRSVTITGEADGRIEDDVTARSGQNVGAAAQFARQADPHGHSVHSNLGRSARFFGSRERERSNAIESTDGGIPVTGSAIGRSVRVTGDEAGTCREVTGNQYLAPARRHVACGGGATPTSSVTDRNDPVTGAKVTVAQTWGGRHVTGIDVEQHPRVSGNAPGACAIVTGSPYQGARTAYSWCDDSAVAQTESRLLARASSVVVTGDTPLNDALITGLARGAARDVTGTPYYREALPATEPPAAPVVAINQRFSVASPQRSAHLNAGSTAPVVDNGRRITGSFAIGHGKVTGNLEFVFRPRPPANGDVAARLRVTGEGRAAGRAITGEVWGEQANVTGIDGSVAGMRNPSERAGKPHAFAGAGRFKTLAGHEEPKHLVTGMFGYSSDSAAKVTLSGGAQG